jgi:hypothetical protein
MSNSTEDGQFVALGGEDGGIPIRVGFLTRATSFGFGADISGTEIGVKGSAEKGLGISGFGSTGVEGSGSTGVAGFGDEVGVQGTSIGNGNGVEGSSKTGYGVFGLVDASRSNKSGVYGSNVADQSAGPGVIGNSTNGDGVFGRSQASDKSGVFGFNSAGELVTAGHEHDPGVALNPRGGGGPGVTGASTIGTGVFGIGGTSGVLGTSELGDGVSGISGADGKSGVFGFNKQLTGAAFGVVGRCESPAGVGVSGGSGSGVGVLGESKLNNGVVGRTENGDLSGIFGENFGKPSLVGGSGSSSPLPPSGVTGKADTGVGVFGTSGNGSGISGKGGTYGGILEGTRAPLRLVPSRSDGPPTAGRHESGEFVVDSSGGLFFCTSPGTPGKWMRVQLVSP